MRWLRIPEKSKLCKIEYEGEPIRTRDQFAKYQESVLHERMQLEKQLAEKCKSAYWRKCKIEGYCEVCNRKTRFLLDYVCSYNDMPNYRERLVCPKCNLNNRMRYIYSKISRECETHHKIYMYEKVTPLYKAVKKKYPNVVGCEYIDSNLKSGTIVNGIMHQNAECLSFCDSSFDLLVSCDVFEHVNDYRKCICEAARVLNPDGKMLLTIPFDTENDFNLRCAEVVEGRLIYYNEPEYHGNPISHKGSLVFWRFGWELLDDICQAGFQDVYMVPYYSVELGYLGGVQSIIVAVK